MDMTLDWLMGFIEGEGCFCISIRKDKEFSKGIRARKCQNGGYSVFPGFGIGQQNDNAEVVNKVYNFLHAHNIYALISYVPANNTRTLQVRRLDDLLRLCDLLEHAQWHSIKQQSFLKFKKVLLMLKNNEHLTKKGMYEIAQIVTNMNSAKGGQQQRRKKVLSEILCRDYLCL